MGKAEFIDGFSKYDLRGRIDAIAGLTKDASGFKKALNEHLHKQPAVQQLYSGISENVLSNYYMPYSIAPNFLINNRLYHVPMVTEESSVVAAASWAAKFWAGHGGFICRSYGKIKKGQVHFIWKGDRGKLMSFFNTVKENIINDIAPETANMEKRGGGIRSIDLVSGDGIPENYYRLEVGFDTIDSMGANFMNTCLEAIASQWKIRVESNTDFAGGERHCDLLMAIFSNYTPDYITRCEVRTKVRNFHAISGKYNTEGFAGRFVHAVQIAREDISRAVTHNKGIFNGMDAVAVSTGNDFRAMEANGHTYASRDGHYRSLSEARVEHDEFIFSIEMPVSMGIVGGTTQVHPLARYSLEILNCESVRELQEITLAAGLASNFSAVKALITEGIQAGHMKLHMANILNQLDASEEAKKSAIRHFDGKPVSYAIVRSFLDSMKMQ